MRKLLIVSALAIPLCGCAEFAGSLTPQNVFFGLSFLDKAFCAKAGNGGEGFCSKQDQKVVKQVGKAIDTLPPPQQ